jgi:putative holliday junction resolvase
MRILALDYGRRRIGIALSDPLGIMAHGQETLQRVNIRTDLAALKSLIEAQQVGQIVVGNPLHMSGEESELSREARAFASRLSDESGIPFLMWDERMSSKEAGRYLAEAGRSKGKRGTVDRMAAELILNSYLGTIG